MPAGKRKNGDGTSGVAKKNKGADAEVSKRGSTTAQITAVSH